MKAACGKCKHWLEGVDVSTETHIPPCHSFGWCESAHASANYQAIQGKKRKGPTGLETRADSFCKFFIAATAAKPAKPAE